MRTLLIMLLFAIATPLSACMWDEDTLAQEAEGIDDVLNIVLGGFPRNPELYYEMRLERAEKLIAADQRAWEAYDNAGVAADRLGKHDNAIAIMSAKVEAMRVAGYDGATQEQPNHSYRAKANLGTFYAHRWFAGGKDFAKTEDILKAKDLIAAAIEENPDAHFGREKYQLRFLEWLLRIASETPIESSEEEPVHQAYPDFLGLGEAKENNNLPSEEELEEMMQGLAGLMKMGAAWESLDVLQCMAYIAQLQEKTSVDRLISVRMTELRAEGKELLYKSGPNRTWSFHIGDRLMPRQDLSREFGQARNKVRIWHIYRRDSLLKKLRAGEHPDTHGDFWEDVYQANGPEFKVSADEDKEDEENRALRVFLGSNEFPILLGIVGGTLFGGGLFGGLFGYFFGRWRLRKKLLKNND